MVTELVTESVTCANAITRPSTLPATATYVSLRELADACSLGQLVAASLTSNGLDPAVPAGSGSIWTSTRPVRSSRQSDFQGSRSGWELRSGEGGARPLGGLEHRAGAAPGQPEPNRSGARHGAGHPATVLPLTPQYRQYRRTSHRPSRPTSTSERPPSNREPAAPPGSSPATPSLPSMRGWFTSPRSTSCDHTTAKVKGAAEGCVVGRSEVARSAVSGEFLARQGQLSAARTAALTTSPRWW